MDVYLGAGHGRRTDGRYDPGAVGNGGVEHELAHVVVGHAALLLAGAGVDVYAESAAGVGHDPNWYGSARAANAARARCAVEVHFDWSGAPRGGFGLYRSSADRELAQEIRNRWGSVGLPQRANAYRTDLGFLNTCTMPAVVWECDRVAAYDRATLERMGAAIARGICDHLGVSFVLTKSDPTPATGQLVVARPIIDQEAPVRSVDYIRTQAGIDANGNGYADLGPWGTIGDVSVNQGDYDDDGSARPGEGIIITGRGNYAGITRVFYTGPANHGPFDLVVESFTE